jgi:superfamily I DNA/RNA helicase
MLFAYVMGNYNIDVAQSTKMKFEKVLRTYIAYKRDNQLYDFTDLPLYLYDMLNKFDEEIETIDALFVDEFQYVDDVQAKIFTKVMAKKFFYIGDERQSIYIFRGAGPQNLRSLTDFERHTLNINYRSYQGIIDYANTMRNGDFICDTVKTKPCDITCARVDEDGEVYVIDKYNDCYDAVSGRQQDLMSTLTAFLLKKPYILCRSNKQVKAIESLGYRNVSTIHQAKGLEYANVIVTDMELSGEEEINIAYVACTRAQNGLLVCDPDLLYTYMNEILFEYRDEICGGKLF